MHIFFSGIGGTGIGPLAMVAQQAGYTVSGSDKQDSQYIEYLRKHGITDITIGQSRDNIAAVHDRQPIDWYVYSSAVQMENPEAPEFRFVHDQNIKLSRRDDLINQILSDKKLNMIAIAGTHGKTTTTAMTVWLFKQVGIPMSYTLPAKVSFGEMGQYQAGAQYFVYEADEFARNFLAYEPYISLITGVSWDHHEIFPTREDYQQAFLEFISQSQHTFIWQDDADYLEVSSGDQLSVLNPGTPEIETISLPGHYTRLDAWLVIQTVHRLTQTPIEQLVKHMNDFPGLQRRMEPIAAHLFSDYAHTPEKVRGGLSVALEMAEPGQNVVVVYEPLTNRRQTHMIDNYGDCFAGASKVYWIPSYLAREEPGARIIPPSELISHLADPTIAEARERDESLLTTIQHHLDQGDMVVAMARGGGNSLDEWIRQHFATK